MCQYLNKNGLTVFPIYMHIPHNYSFTLRMSFMPMEMVMTSWGGKIPGTLNWIPRGVTISLSLGNTCRRRLLSKEQDEAIVARNRNTKCNDYY